MQSTRDHFIEAQKVLHNFVSEGGNLDRIDQAIAVMSEAIQAGGKILSCGNGGSMCDAMHFAEELSGRYRNDRRALPAISMSDPSHLSCVANDYGFESVFSRYLEAIGKPGDVLLAISTSGNSPNVCKAAEVAKEMGITVIALTGKSGGALAHLAHLEIRAPYSDYADRAQEIHIKVIHAIIDGIERKLSL